MASLQETSCCGLGEIDGVGGSSQASIMREVRHANWLSYGMVFATTTQEQKTAETRLTACGFTVRRKFKNPNTGNTVKVWMRGTKDVKPLARRWTSSWDY